MPLRSVGMDPAYGVSKAPAGSTVYVDVPNKRARVTRPDGQIWSWDGLRKIRVRPGSTWEVTWMQEGNEPRIYFSAMEEDCDDEVVRQTGYNFTSEEIEGQEHKLFPEFVRLMKDPVLNPSGLPLKSAVYSQFFVNFHINFGEDGSTPSITTIEDTAPPVLDFPYRTNIIVRDMFMLNGRQIKPGPYETEVMGFNTETGEVIDIQCDGYYLGSFHTDGAEIARLMHEGKIDMVEVVQDRMPNF